MAYPSSLDSYIAVAGTTLVASAGHAAMHNTVGSAVVALETAVGTTLGTNVLKNFAAGKLAVYNTAGTLDQGVLGTPMIRGGTVGTAMIGTSTFQGGTVNNAVIGTPTLTLGGDTSGDMFFRSAGGTVNRVGIGANGQVLTTNGTTPSWGAVSSEANDGWIAAGGTWSYSSGSVVTINADLTTWMQKGDKIKLTQGGTVKYYNLAGFGLASGTTTGTFLGDKGTALSNVAISSPYFSKKEIALGFPPYFNYNGTVTNPVGFTGSNSGTTAIYYIKGGWCTVDSEWQITSSSGGTGTSFTVNLPITAAMINTNNWLGMFAAQRTNGGWCRVNYSNTGVVACYTSTCGTFPAIDNEYIVNITYPY